MSRTVEIETPLVERVDRILAASEGKAPVSFESIVNMAVESFCDGAETVL